MICSTAMVEVYSLHLYKNIKEYNILYYEVINEVNNYKVELHTKLLIGTQIHIFNLFFFAVVKGSSSL